MTVAVTDQVLPIRSWKVKMNDPLSVNIYHVAESHVIGSLNPVMLTITFPLVRFPEFGEYIILAVGLLLSIHVTVAVADHVLPMASLKKNVNAPFHRKMV